MKSIKFQTFVFSIGVFSAVAEESPQAVSGINGKIDYTGGWMDSAEAHNIGVSVTAPIGVHFGFQMDGLYTHVSGRDFVGGAGHFFWRDPNVGLFGVSGGGIHCGGVLDTYQAVLEGEYYWDRFTLSAFAGAGNISYDVAVPFINTNPTTFSARLALDWYVIDDLRLGIGYAYFFENHLGQIEAEYQTPWKGLCLMAEYARGENDYDHALFGVRFYFGKDKSLEERHRYDDPRSLAPDILTGAGLYGAEFNRKASSYLRGRTQVSNSGPKQPPQRDPPFDLNSDSGIIRVDPTIYPDPNQDND